jgi:D-arginine dehydrogenase
VTAPPRVLVVGGGIAGVSVASALADRAAVTLVERESTLAFHSTGRSAALYFENYGAPSIRPLTRASRLFFDAPPGGLTDHPLLSRRGALTIAREEHLADLDVVETEGRRDGAKIELLDTAAARSICPVLREEAVAGALWEPDAADMDVAAIHQAFVRDIRRSGGEIHVSRTLVAAERHASGWTAQLDGGTWHGDVIVDAAGAWGDIVAEACGVAPVGLEPRRRTAFMVSGSAAGSGWPLVVGVHHDFYFKGDGEQLLCSLADETPSEPCDARPEEIDVALAIERINAATTLAIRSVRSQWAGLRTFAPDGGMVIGPDAVEPAFIWLVGQGGTGIQTAPAAGRLAAALALGEPPPDDIVGDGLDTTALAVARLRS